MLTIGFPDSPGTPQYWVNFAELVLFSLPNVLVLAQFGIITRIWAAVSRDVSFSSRAATRPTLLFRVIVGAYATLQLLLYIVYFFDNFLVVISWHAIISTVFNLVAALAFVASYVELHRVLNPDRRREHLTSGYASDDSGGMEKAYGLSRGQKVPDYDDDDGADMSEVGRGASSASEDDDDETSSILAARRGGASAARVYDPELAYHGDVGTGSRVDGASGVEGERGRGGQPAVANDAAGGKARTSLVGLEYRRDDPSFNALGSNILGVEASGGDEFGASGERPKAAIGIVDGNFGRASVDHFPDVRRVYSTQRRAARETMSKRIAAVAITCACCFVFRACCEVFELTLAKGEGSHFASVQKVWWAVVTAYYVLAEILPSFVVLYVLRQGGSSLVRG